MQFLKKDRDQNVHSDLLPLEYRHKYFFGIRFSIWVEVVFFYGVLVLADIFFFAGDRYNHVSPHPFWLPILFMAAQYGTNAGLLSAFVATVTFIVGNLPMLTVKYDFYEYVKDVSAEPILWFVGAVFLGEIRNRHMRERDVLRERVIELDKDAQTIAGSYEDLKKANKSLEKRVASHNKSFLTLYEASQKLETLEQNNVLSSFQEIIETLLSPKKYSFFLFEKESLNLVQNMNWDEQDSFKRSFDVDSRLYKAIIEKNMFLCALVESQQDILEKQGILAGPIKHPQTGMCFGMLKIEDIPMLELTPTGIENFKKLCQWMAIVLARSSAYAGAVSSSFQDASSHLLSAGFIDYQIDLLRKLGERFKFQSSIVSFSLSSHVKLNQKGYLAFVSLVREAVKPQLRGTDLIFDSFHKDQKFVIVLVGTPLDKAENVVQKIVKEIEPQLLAFLNMKDFHATVQAI